MDKEKGERKKKREKEERGEKKGREKKIKCHKMFRDGKG
jgi:hypothetical protein